MDNKFCTKCGFELPITAKFCERCGNSITNSKDEFIPQSKTTKKKSGNALQNIIIIGGVLLFFIVIGLCNLDIDLDKNKNANTSIKSTSSVSSVALPDETHYNLKRTFTGGKTLDYWSKPFYTSTRTVAIVLKKDYTTYLAQACINVANEDISFKLPSDNCIRLEKSVDEGVVWPSDIVAGNVMYEIGVVADGDWEVQVWEMKGLNK